MRPLHSLCVILLIALAGCDTIGGDVEASALRNRNTEELWSLYRQDHPPSYLSLVEVELMRRGAFFSGTHDSWLGQRSILKPQSYARNAGRGDCTAFPIAPDAQLRFLESGGPDRDPGGLDPDGDGFACGYRACLEYALAEKKRQQGDYEAWRRRELEANRREAARVAQGSGIVSLPGPTLLPIDYTPPKPRPVPAGCTA